MRKTWASSVFFKTIGLLLYFLIMTRASFVLSPLNILHHFKQGDQQRKKESVQLLKLNGHKAEAVVEQSVGMTSVLSRQCCVLYSSKPLGQIIAVRL